MMVNAARSPLLPVAAPAAPPAPADKATQPDAAAHPFAEMLRQNRQAETPSTAESKATATTDSKSPTTLANAVDHALPAIHLTPPASRDAAQARARTAAASHAPARSTLPSAQATADTDKTHDTKDEDAASTASSSDASTTATPATITPPALAPRGDAAPGEHAYATALTASAANGKAPGLGASNTAQASDAVTIDASARPGISASAAEAPTATADAVARAADKTSESSAREAIPSFAETLAEARTSHRGDAPSSPGELGHAATASATALAEPTRNAAPAADSALTTSTVPVPVDSPEFAAAFGLQVSTLARDGVQHAELHLNPTDMGPVSIQITLDGTQARVDFGADAAATRYAIEAGLPELASALRDAGFTLAGGGVTQHSRSNGDQADDASSGDAGSRRSAPAAVARLDAAAQRATRRAAAGGVDLYA